MHAALVARDRMKFVDNYVADRTQLLAKPRRGQQDEQRFGRRDQDLRWPLQHRRPLARRRVAGSKSRANRRELQPEFQRDRLDPGQRLFEI